jgi:hypothetical protein
MPTYPPTATFFLKSGCPQADVDKDGDIEVEELNLILKALEKDGIRVSDLSYEKV